MITVVIGASGSGKSEFAENILSAYPTNKYYIATMRPYDEEMKQKIKRHHELRKEKRFQTIECYEEIASVCLPKDSVVLVECMSNLVANEMYQENKSLDEKAVCEKIVAGIIQLDTTCKQLVIVTNDVFSSGEQYDLLTMRYMKTLGKINQRLSMVATNVVEVICGIPVWVKKKEEKE